MQVYREIPIISNQARKQSAELTGITSVTEEWSVAKHRDAADALIASNSSPSFVLDAGTGMYLNAILLDLYLAPKVSPKVREKAQAMVEGEPLRSGIENTRRRIREVELSLSGADTRNSVWDGDLRFETDLIYLRPSRERIAEAIEKRTERILNFGIDEVSSLGAEPSIWNNVSLQVLGAIGFREIDQYLKGSITLPEARENISRRTRSLAKRQIRWFDKLSKTLENRANSIIVESSTELELEHYMHDILNR